MKVSSFGLTLYLEVVENILLLPSSVVKPITTRRVFFCGVLDSLQLPVTNAYIVASDCSFYAAFGRPQYIDALGCEVSSELLLLTSLYVVRWVVIQDHSVIFFEKFLLA